MELLAHDQMTKVEHWAFAWFLLCCKTNRAHGEIFSIQSFDIVHVPNSILHYSCENTIVLPERHCIYICILANLKVIWIPSWCQKNGIHETERRLQQQSQINVEV